MTKPWVIGAAFLLSLAMTGTAYGQGGTPITSRDVIGQWTLRVTPAERRGFSITVESEDGGRPDLSLAITARPGGRLTCVVGGEPADCEVSDGELVITSVRSGGASMTFTLADRTPSGFAGSARMKARLLPFGTVHIGSVNMIRH